MSTAYVLGAGGHARTVIDILTCQNQFQKILVFDESFLGNEETILGARVVGKISDIFKFTRGENIFLALGTISTRKKIIDDLNLLRFNIQNLIHPKSQVSRSAKLGKGNYVGAFANIGPMSQIGDFNIVNTHANIEHEVKIGSFNNISPNSVVCGRSSVGDSVFIGASSVVNENLAISNGVIVGSNSTVTQNLTKQFTTYIGTPARPQ